MASENTKEQIRRFLQNAVDRAKNPDPREKLRRIRKYNEKKVAKKYGF